VTGTEKRPAAARGRLPRTRPAGAGCRRRRPSRWSC